MDKVANGLKGDKPSGIWRVEENTVRPKGKNSQRKKHQQIRNLDGQNMRSPGCLRQSPAKAVITNSKRFSTVSSTETERDQMIENQQYLINTQKKLQPDQMQDPGESSIRKEIEDGESLASTTVNSNLVSLNVRMNHRLIKSNDETAPPQNQGHGREQDDLNQLKTHC